MARSLNSKNYGPNQNEERLRMFFQQFQESQRASDSRDAAQAMKEAELGQARELRQAEAAQRDSHHKDDMAQKEKDMRLRILLGLKDQQKPLSVDQERSERLANEGLSATERLTSAMPENPGATSAVRFGEALENIPLIGGLAKSGVVGAASLFNPAAKDIADDRKRVAMSKTYIDSGASAREDEQRANTALQPGVLSDKDETKRRYETFAAPFRQTLQMHKSKTQAQPIDPDAATKYVMEGGEMPGPRAPAPSPQQPPAETPEQKYLRLKQKYNR